MGLVQPQSFTSFFADSRKCIEGGLFFALKGARVEGHDFLQEVAEKGAKGAVVQRGYQGASFGLELFVVEDVRRHLQLMAKQAFAKRREKVIAITGSMGKTTTKEFLSTLLSGTYRVAKTPGNCNSQVSVPLFLLNLSEEFDFLVIEMGMSKRGEIQCLCDLAPPTIAMVTRIAPAGLEEFAGGLDAVAKAKGEIFSHPLTEVGVISEQAARFVKHFKDVPIMLYRDVPIPSPFSASHLCENFAGAATVAHLLGVTWDEIAKRAKGLRTVPLRFEEIAFRGCTFIQDCYNANPDSMRIAFANLPKGKRVIGVLGDMPDLGEETERFHREVGRHAIEIFDQLFCIGEKAKEIGRAFAESGKPVIYGRDFSLEKFLKVGDVVLIKGANYLRLWEILEEIRASTVH